MADNMQGSLTGNTLNTPASAAPADDPDNLDKLFAQMEDALKTQGAANQQAINTMGVGQQAAIQATAPPTPEPVPATISPTARAMATFGAGMGSSLTHNPAMLQGMQNQLATADANRFAIQHSNYAHRAAFDEQKQGTLLSHQVRLLELKADEQIKMGDRDGAIQTLKAQTAIAEKLRKIKLEDELNVKNTLLGRRLQGALDVVSARGEQARKTQEAKDNALTGGMDKSQLAEYAQRAAAARASAKAELDDIATLAGGRGANSEEGMAQVQHIQDKLDYDLRNLASEIRRSNVVRTPAPEGAPPAVTTPPGVSVDAHGIPTDPIRRAAYMRSHPAK